MADTNGRDINAGFASELIKQALQSGALKLNGSLGAATEASAREAAQRDALYLRVLVDEMISGPKR